MHEISESTGAVFHGLAAVQNQEDVELLWSDHSGTFAQATNAHGGPRGEPRRITGPCPGGIAATAYRDHVLLACIRPGDRDRGRAGALVLFEVADHSTVVGSVTPIGDRSDSPSIAADGDRAVVGWRDADVFLSRARSVEVVRGLVGEPTWVSSVGTLASGPSPTFVQGELIQAWTESWIQAGHPTGHLLTRRESQPPMPSLEVHDIDVHTYLTADAEGPLVALRDTRPRGARHRSFVGRLDPHLRLDVEDLHSPVRADGSGGHPLIIPCGGHIFSLATRRSSRGVTMVTVRRLSSSLESVEGEQQIYEYHHRLTRSVGVCVDEHLVLLVAERQTEARPRPRLQTYEVRCGPGVEHQRTPPST